MIIYKVDVLMHSKTCQHIINPIETKTNHAVEKVWVKDALLDTMAEITMTALYITL